MKTTATILVENKLKKKCEYVLQYPIAALFEVALPYCNNEHTTIVTSITADEKLRFLIQGIWSRRRGLDSA